MPDEDLMRRYCAGDAVAFDTLYHRHKGPLYRYLRRQTGETHADELFQDIWMKIVNARKTYHVSAKFTTFLYTVAHRRVIDHYRRNNKGVMLSYDENADPEGDCPATIAGDEGKQPENAADRARQVARLFELIEGLPAAQREAFLLQEESGLSIDEIAAATNVKPETAKSRVRYAIQKLRQGLSSE